jgi:hypothetical protein
VQWGDVAQIKASGWLGRKLTLEYKTAKKETYMAFSMGDGKKVAAISSALIEAGAGERSPAQEPVQLCPDCRAALTPGIYRCSSCGLQFKDEKTMMWRSIFLPAGGYFYTGHPLVALPPALLEIYLLILIILPIFNPALRPHRKLDIVVGLTAFALAWGLETATTILHCRRYIREFIPLRRTNTGALKRAEAASKI